MKKTHNPGRAKSLAEQIRQQLLWLGLVLFVSCLVLVFVFSLRSTTLITEKLMMLEAETLLRQIQQRPDTLLPRNKVFSAYRRPQNLPKSVLKFFGEATIPSEQVIEIPFSDRDDTPGFFYLLRHGDPDGEELITLSRHNADEVATIFDAFFTRALVEALWLTAIIFIALFFLIRWLIRRTSEPLELLSQWASVLNTQPDQSGNIIFPIEELNQIASQLREGTAKLQVYNEREQQFLKHASHELRTPLAIIQASLDTLDLKSDASTQVVVQRALKASANMRQLCATLLWLARESRGGEIKSPTDLAALCRQIIGDYQSLLRHRRIEIRTTFSAGIIDIEKDLLTIVISNLVRNAFQHSAVGTVKLQGSDCGISISNPVDTKMTPDDGIGRGLGLQLVQRICKKQKWRYSFTSNSEAAVVTVYWSDKVLRCS